MAGWYNGAPAKRDSLPPLAPAPRAERPAAAPRALNTPAYNPSCCRAPKGPRTHAMSAHLPKDRLIIFDTTMRDGEQSPGASMTREEKLRIARSLERMRVDVIEAGFPASSNGDFEAGKGLPRGGRGAARCGPWPAEGRGNPRAPPAPP